jgi:arylsulfatase A-like enzyme
VDDTHLISNGLDILPTLCEAAQVDKPAALEGRSLLSIAKGEKAAEWREYLVVETHLARLVHMNKWKYVVVRDEPHADVECSICQHLPREYETSVREMLIDLETDPGEMVNKAQDSYAAGHLLEGRNMLRNRSQNGYPLDNRYICEE